MTAGLATFAKVRALHDRATSPGEKAAAASRMDTLARKVGMTVAEAVSKLDAPAPAAPRNFFEELFNTPEFRAQEAEREHQRAVGRAAALSEHGSEDAIWAACIREAALEAACRPVITRKPIINGEMDTLLGWDGGRWDRLPPEAQAAVAGAYPLPPTVPETLAEFRYWEKRGDERSAFDRSYDHRLEIRARTAFLEHRLDTLPALSLNDLRARLEWMRFLNEREWNRGNPEDRTLLDRLTADIERMGQRLREQGAEPVQSGRPRHPDDGLKSQPISPVQSGHARRTNADKRRDVLALFGLGLTDREIARRAGVSPSTVGNIRKATA